MVEGEAISYEEQTKYEFEIRIVNLNLQKAVI
jgi:hypothetical protein